MCNSHKYQASTFDELRTLLSHRICELKICAYNVGQLFFDLGGLQGMQFLECQRDDIDTDITSEVWVPSKLSKPEAQFAPDRRDTNI